MKVYADRDQNGLPDNTEDLLVGSIELNAGQSLAVLLVGSIPTNVSFNQLSSLDLIYLRRTFGFQVDITLWAIKIKI